MSSVNLLPQEEKELLVQEEKWKLILILEIILLAFFISLALILFSIKTYISGQVEAQKILLSQKELDAPHIQQLEKNIKDNNLIFAQLHSFYQERISVTGALEKISQVLPEKLYLSTLNFTVLTSQQSKYSAQISLSGFAPTRELLLEFKERLEGQEHFKEVYFPASNWLKPTDINFSVSFKIAK